MDERETLIRVEQQLQDSIKNQGLILSDLKELFSKIELESKVIAGVKSDLSSHLEMTVVRREDSDRRFRSLEDGKKELLDDISYLKDELLKSIDKLKSDLEAETKKRSEETQESKIFQKQITTSLNLLKWILGFLVLAITAFWPVFIFFKPHP